MTDNEFLARISKDLGKLGMIEARAAIRTQGGGALTFMRVKAQRATSVHEKDIYAMAAFIIKRHPCGDLPSIIDFEMAHAKQRGVA
jgi:hypothetical protein